MSITNEEYKLIAFAFLSKDAHWNLNKNLCKMVGVESALVMADLISKSDYFEKNSGMTDDGYFYNTTENISNDTNLTRYSIELSVKTLKREGFLFIKKAGMPAKNHYKVNFTALISKITQFAENGATSSLKTGQHVGPFSATNNNKENNNKKEVLNLNTEAKAPVEFQPELFPEKEAKPIKEDKPKVMTLREKIIEFWLKEFHVGWGFTGTDGKKINSLITRLQNSLKGTSKKDSFTEEDVLNLFKSFCLKLPEFYKNETLSVLESKYDTIIEKIKESNAKQSNQTGQRSGVTNFRFDVPSV